MVIIELWSLFRWQKTQYMRRKMASLAEALGIVGSREHQKPDINLLTAKSLVHLHLLPLKIVIPLLESANGECSVTVFVTAQVPSSASEQLLTFVVMREG